MSALARYLTQNPVYHREVRGRWSRGRLWLAPFVLFGLFVLASLGALVPYWFDRPDWFIQDYPPIVAMIAYGFASAAAVLLGPGLAALFLVAERSRQTLESVLLTPPTPAQVLLGKAGAAVRFVWACALPCLLVMCYALVVCWAIAIPETYIWPWFYQTAWLQWVEVLLLTLFAVGVGSLAGSLARRPGAAVAGAYGVAVPLYVLFKHWPWLPYLRAGGSGEQPWPTDDPTTYAWRLILPWVCYLIVGLAALALAHRRLRREAGLERELAPARETELEAPHETERFAYRGLEQFRIPPRPSKSTTPPPDEDADAQEP